MSGKRRPLLGWEMDDLDSDVRTQMGEDVVTYTTTSVSVDTTDFDITADSVGMETELVSMGVEPGSTGLYGEVAQASGKFTTAGDAKVRRLTARVTTTNATPTTLKLDGSSELLVLPNSTTWGFRATVVGRNNTDGESAIYFAQGGIDRGANAAATAVVAAITPTAIEDVGAWDCTFTADTTNGALSITVTGEAATTIKWLALVEIVQITG